MENKVTVLKGKAWHEYITGQDLRGKKQEELYSGTTYKHTPIYKIGDYFFVLGILRGYLNISSLKKLL